MSVVDLGPVVRTVEVRRTPAEAFHLFVDQMSAWWPLKTHSRAKDAAQVRGGFAAGFDAVFIRGFGEYAGLIAHGS